MVFDGFLAAVGQHRSTRSAGEGAQVAVVAAQDRVVTVTSESQARIAAAEQGVTDAEVAAQSQADSVISSKEAVNMALDEVVSALRAVVQAL